MALIRARWYLVLTIMETDDNILCRIGSVIGKRTREGLDNLVAPTIIFLMTKVEVGSLDCDILW